MDAISQASANVIAAIDHYRITSAALIKATANGQAAIAAAQAAVSAAQAAENDANTAVAAANTALQKAVAADYTAAQQGQSIPDPTAPVAAPITTASIKG